MDIRGERTWCARCTAPEVLPENIPLIELFIQALPAYQGGQGLLGSAAMEGFDRAQVLALMQLRGLPEAERPDAWTALADLEDLYRHIRAAKAKTTKAN